MHSATQGSTSKQRVFLVSKPGRKGQKPSNRSVWVSTPGLLPVRLMLWMNGIHLAMGQNPNPKSPSEDPNPTTKIGSKMDGASTPKWDPMVLIHGHFATTVPKPWNDSSPQRKYQQAFWFHSLGSSFRGAVSDVVTIHTFSLGLIRGFSPGFEAARCLDFAPPSATHFRRPLCKHQTPRLLLGFCVVRGIRMEP